VQTLKCFEVVVVEDGSSRKGDAVVEKYRGVLDLSYFGKPNSGPGLSRNAGAARARYDYLVFFDSDCIVPPVYFETVSRFLCDGGVDAYGGPDAALPTFTKVQRAISYAMTSFLTTGGIRGDRKSVEKFNPRSFNMGVSRRAFEETGGFDSMRFGEDIDFSLRLSKGGFRTVLIPEAFVYHKRRSTFRQFFKQVFNSGIARINLHLRHPGSLRVVHLLPACFTTGMGAVFVFSLFYPALLTLPALFSAVIFADSLAKNGAFKVALYSIAAAWIQLTGYGSGFLAAVWRRLIMRGGEFRAFAKRFYD
jgi:GT2 family glycosyltransferase